jgi:hypothetical protein
VRSLACFLDLILVSGIGAACLAGVLQCQMAGVGCTVASALVRRHRKELSACGRP